MKQLSIILSLVLTSITFAQVSFVSTPTLTKEGSTFFVRFELSQATDVTVSIVNPRDSIVVCHLAAGMLGANAPSPLEKGTLRQTIAWDGKDDLGKVAAYPESLTVRV
ncbi:MAG: hypothetical protein JNL74_17385, partial [Fibrobacteres bacterium]|nr:hypothetical protein [Fibrobacterota bacterium]